MATATAAAVKKPSVKEFNFTWVGQDKAGKTVRGEMRATGEAQVNATLRRQGIKIGQVKRQRLSRGGRITEKDITLFTRQLATMMKSGVPLLQAFDIVGKGHTNGAVAKLLMDIKTEVETGSSLKQAFEKHPLYFDALFCNLVGAGEQAGILDSLLDRLATYKEKVQAIKGKIKAALFYPVAIIVVAFVITAVIMIFVIPAFKQVFASFGADLPGPTLVVMAISEFFVKFAKPRSRAGRARWLRCLPPACRWSKRSTPWRAPRAIMNTISRPRKSRLRFPRAPASRYRCKTSKCSPTWCCRWSRSAKSRARSMRCCPRWRISSRPRWTTP
jgi:hypothetical protein